MKNILLIITTMILFKYSAFSCFNTYLFLQKGSMVYPHKSMGFDITGEYSMTRLNSPSEDQYFSTGGFYYGIYEQFSVKISVGSTEKSRGNFNLDFVGIDGVYNIYNDELNTYTLDLMMQYQRYLESIENEIAVSAPNIFRISDYTYVIHPTVNYLLNKNNFQIGIHAGIFYDFNSTGIIGIGAEYYTPQTSGFINKRLSQSEFATNLFIGARIGNYFYIQNEIAKGFANTCDFGFAITAKLLL